MYDEMMINAITVCLALCLAVICYNNITSEQVSLQAAHVTHTMIIESRLRPTLFNDAASG